MRCPICGSKDCCGGDVAQQVERLEKEKAELIEEAEPVAYLIPNGIRISRDVDPKEGEPEVPLYLRPQPKAILTDEEIEEIHREFPSRIDLFARAIERKIWGKPRGL